MNWLILAVTTSLCLAALIALRPAHRGPLAMLSWTVGWPAGELAGAHVVAQLLALGVLWWWGYPHGWFAALLNVLAVIGITANFVLVLGMLAARRAARRGVLTSGPFPLPWHAVGRGRFVTWWRTLLILPLRSRDVLVQRNVPYGTAKRQVLDVLRTSRTPSNAPVLFYVHGGAWTYGDKREQARPMLFEFVRRGWIVVAINYRLAPRDVWPAQIEDTKRALAWVKRTIHAYGGDPHNVVVSGGSAGGHLSALLALTGNSHEWRPDDVPHDLDLTVRGAVPFYGVLEMTGDREVWRRHGRGLKVLLEDYVMKKKVAEHESLFRLASPLERVTPDAPPFLLIQGKNDTLVDYNVNRAFAARYREVVPHGQLWHVETPLAQHAFDLSHSPRTTATTRAAVAFATWAIGRAPETYPDVPAQLVKSYQAPPALLTVSVDGVETPPKKAATSFGPLYVVTACNPISNEQVPASAERNAAATAQLRREVEWLGWNYLLSEGRDPKSEEWREPGVALFGVSRRAAQLLARRYRQYAFYEVTPNEVLVRSAATGEVVR